MMQKIIALLVSSICGFSVVLTLGNLFSIAANQMTSPESIAATVDLAPNDAPRAGQASVTRFMLTQAAGKNIAPADCACQIALYSADHHLIMRNLPISTTQVEGQPALSTIITFPTPGVYRLVLTGQSNDGSFEPFVVNFPVKVNA